MCLIFCTELVYYISVLLGMVDFVPQLTNVTTTYGTDSFKFENMSAISSEASQWIAKNSSVSVPCLFGCLSTKML